MLRVMYWPGWGRRWLLGSAGDFWCWLLGNETLKCNVSTGAGREGILWILYLLGVSKCRNKYRTDSIRASWWDYTKPGCYFVTICTYGRKWVFGEVQYKSMKLSPTGVLVDKFWCEIPDHFPHVKLGVYVVMPNHVHGILFLDPTGSASAENREEHTADDVETGRALSLQ